MVTRHHAAQMPALSAVKQIRHILTSPERAHLHHDVLHVFVVFGMKERCEFLFVRHHVTVGVRRSETSLVPPHHVTVVVLQVDWGVLCEQEAIRRLMSMFV